MRQLTKTELNKLEFLTSKQVEVALIEPTATGLVKSIMDATSIIRDFLGRKGVHDFSSQLQGPDNKKIISTKIITSDDIINTRTSLYRPNTKKGDPRIWISGINNICKANDIIAIAYFDKSLWVFNLTQLDLSKLSEHATPFSKFIEQYRDQQNETATELLQKIQRIADRGYIPSPYKGDTAIGRLLETELGIAINSSKDPDYKGIEIKSARTERKNRKNLFAQVPDWNISVLKSSREILDKYGYYSDEGIKRLYCTVTSKNFNPQTLRLRVENDDGILVEYSSRDGDVVSWKASTLEKRLLTKHRETFWVDAISKTEAGVEYFKFIKIEHTRDPLATQLAVLLDQGKITLDHLIKESGKSAREKGPIFKLESNSLALLFPPSEVYTL